MPRLRELPPEALDELEAVFVELDHTQRAIRSVFPFSLVQDHELVQQSVRIGERLAAWPRKHGLVPPLPRWSMRIDTLMQKIVERFPTVLAHLPDEDLSVYFIDEQHLNPAWHFPVRDQALEAEALASYLSPTRAFHADQKRVLVVGPPI